ncbi:MAG: glycoside hydrolase family 16 [Lasallia pustulata]|uniref:Glycoside hydrolase family 16 n=1 Tax=Lasallia pustulata TaxID=136370 RepID=A0A5M8PGV6_9LECA|nr:MAG: glycoside hydrolase family 16 [Lasallia pustulata]
MSPTPPIPLLALLLLLLSPPTRADCECGYTVNATLYTDLLETDFLHLPNITRDTDWQPQNYTVSPAAARGPYGKNASLSNVVANPLHDNNTSAGPGLLGGDPGLQLWVRGGIPQDGLIPIAEIASARDDMLYGSFRASMKLTGTPGTCGAFFWYYNNSQEIDLEFLSRQFPPPSNASTTYPLNLVLQSPLSALANSAAHTPTFTTYPLPFCPTAAYHEYRFDWSPRAVTFYADSVPLASMNLSVPSAPGSVHLSHWSNGDAGWSAGPPAADAVLAVGYVKAYFNSSAERRQADWRARCKDLSAKGATCVVPDQEGPPGEAETWFFSQQANMTGNQTVFGG